MWWTTRCGNRDTIKDKCYRYYKDFIVKYEKKQLNIINKDVNQNSQESSSSFNGLTREEIEKNKHLVNNGIPLIKPLGCGNYIAWRDMKYKTEEKNNMLKNNSNTDYDIKFWEIYKKEEREQFQNEIQELESIQ